MQWHGTVYRVITLAFVAFGSAFAADPETTDADRLKESLAKWEKVRADCGGDYSYQVRWSSFAGFGHTTTVTVKANKVVERKYEVFERPQPGNPPGGAKLKWVEMGKDLGSHKSEGAAPRTLDELYAEAANLVKMEVPANHKRYLGFDKQGLLTHCFTVDTRIADDAPRVGISPIQVQLKPKK